MDYQTFKAKRDELEAAAKAAGSILSAIPGVGTGPMGLTPDNVKFSTQYRKARAAMERAREAARAFNGAWAGKFKKEIRADIDARRAAILATR